MPRKHNSRALRRQATALRMEHLRDQMLAARLARRAQRRVEMRLAAIPKYGRITRALTDIAVQDRIDAVELAQINLDRAAVGLPPLNEIPLD